ncbi:MAG: PAS domain S-box protein [Ekhidna sp.]|nr:PAS domain S-box protein [Ekhidna sp.]
MSSIENHKWILDSVPYGIICLSREGVVSYVNEKIYALFSRNARKPLTGLKYSDINWLQLKKTTGEKLDPFFIYTDSGTKDDAFFKCVSIGQGTQNWFEVHISFAERTDPGRGIVLTIKEISQQEPTNLTTNVENDDSGRYQILLENIDAVVWESGFGTKTFSYISPKVEELFGFPKSDWFQEGFWQSRIFEEDKQHVIAYESQKALEVQNYQLEYRLLNSKDEIVWIRDSVEVVKEGGKAVMLRGMMLDISDQKESRMLLKESEKRYRELLDEAPYAIMVYNQEGILIAANAKCEAYWMIDLNSYIGNFNVFDNDIFIKEPHKKAVKDSFGGNSGEIALDLHLPHTKKDKKFRIKYYPLLDSDGKLENVIYFTEDITQYVQAGEDIRYQESLKQGILNALDQAILVVNEQGKIINVNQKLQNYVRMAPSSKLDIGSSVFDFIELLEDAEILKSGLKSILSEESRVLDHEIKMADDKWYNIRATPLKEPFGAVITWQNINTRKEIEMALEKSLRKYRNIYNKAPVMMHSINEQLQIVSVSDFWLEKMGYDRNEVIGKTPADFLADQSKPRSADNMKRLFTEGFVRNAEYTFRKKSGEEIDVLLSAVAEYGESGNFERSITGMLDVTDLKVTERQLQESQSKLLESQRISKIANYEFDVLTGLFRPSPEMVSLMGFSANDKHVSVIEKLIHPDDLNEFRERLNACISEGKEFFHIYRIFHLRSQSLKWISGRGKMLKDRDGRVVKMIGTVQDITEQKHTEQRIRKLSDRVLLATEIANLGVWEYDRDKDEIFWEAQMYSIFPDAKAPLSFEELSQYFSKGDQKAVNTSLEMIKTGVNFLESEVKMHSSKGDKYLRAYTRVLRDEKGKLKGMVGVVYDVSADKELQKKLEESLEEKNVLIKEVHHRVKNNMQLISSILALKSYELDSDLSKAIFEEINDRIKAMAVIHDKLYTFYNVSEIDISEYLNHLAKELQTILLSSNFVIEVESDPVVFDVEKALLMGLIVSEMVGNAVKHGFKNRTDGIVSVRFGKSDQGHLLSVVNNGERVPQDVVDSSTGLGISLIKTFTKQLKGKLSYDEGNGLKVHF